jgi:hypothetical protein
MVVSIGFSLHNVCGIQFFASHLNLALERNGIVTSHLNGMQIKEIPLADQIILHYVPSSITEPHTTKILIKLLTHNYKKIIVVLHGFYGRNENRFRKDTQCPDAEIHADYILRYANQIICLSESVQLSIMSWNINQSKAELILLGHPGLFTTSQSVNRKNKKSCYVLIAGIERPKKNRESQTIKKISSICSRYNIDLRFHWSNISTKTAKEQINRKTTFGPLTDYQWSSLIEGAEAILCPYETSIQSVSGIIPEALSVGIRVISTSFDYSNEMCRKYPEKMFVNDDLNTWLNALMNPDYRKKKDNYKKEFSWQIFSKQIIALL